VISDPAGIDCTSTCAVAFAPGALVTLTATPDPGQLFQGYAGDCSDAACALPAIVGDQVVQATFHGDPASFWKRRYGGAWTDATTVAVDAAGNVVVAGQFTEQVDVGVSLATDQRDVFVARYNSSGQLLWARQFHQAMVLEGRTLATLPSGDVIVGGSFAGSTDLGDGVTRTSAGEVDLFVARLAADDGAVRWVHTEGGPGYDLVRGLTVDAGGDVRVTGDFRNLIDFGAGPIPGAYWGTAFVLRLRGDTGALSWAFTRPDAPGAAEGSAIAVDAAGRTYAIELPLRMNQGDLRHLVLFVLDADGQLAREQDLVGIYVSSIAATPDDALVVAGAFGGSIDLDGHLATAHGATTDAFVAGLGLDGRFRWLRAFGGVAGHDEVSAVAVAPTGEVTVTGAYFGVVRFGDDASTERLATGESDVFVASYGADGRFIGAAVVGGAAADRGMAVGVGGAGVGALVGRFTSSMDLLGESLAAEGDDDLFVVATSYLPMDGEL
jgi:hypothetical protein